MYTVAVPVDDSINADVDASPNAPTPAANAGAAIPPVTAINPPPINPTPPILAHFFHFGWFVSDFV